MKKYGYVRRDFNCDTQTQVTKLKVSGSSEIYYEDEDINSTVELQKLLDIVQPEDEIIVYDLNVFGKELRKLSELASTLLTKEVSLIALQNYIGKENSTSFLYYCIELNKVNNTVHAYKTKRALEISRMAGRTLGRPSTNQETVDKIQELYFNYRHSMRDIAEALEVSLGTVHKYTKKTKN